MIKGILFDYGGTLDTGGRHWSEVIWDGYKSASIQIPKEQFRSAYVYAERELERTPHIKPEDTFYILLRKKIKIEMQELVRTGTLPADYPIDAKSDEAARYCDTVARSHVKKSAEVLSALSRKYPLVLVTNFYGNIRSVITEYGIARYFMDIVESAVVGCRKPSEEIFRIARERLGTQPDETLVVGDSYKNDIAPAIKQGMQAIWLKNESWNDSEKNIEYTKIIDTIEELLSMV